MAYIKRDRDQDAGCVFCRMSDPAQELAQVVVARSSHSFIALNRYPYSNGHLMIVPYAHVATPEDLPAAALADITELTHRSLRILRDVCQPSAFNTGANIGADAGAGIAEHYHFHVVPRWAGDANFMTTVGGARLIPDTLDNLREELQAAWRRRYGGEDPV